MGTLGAKDWGLGTRDGLWGLRLGTRTGFWDQETADLGDQGLGTRGQGMGNQEQDTSGQGEETGNSGPGTPRAGAGAVPRREGTREGSRSLTQREPPRDCHPRQRQLSSRRAQPAAPGAPSLLLNFPAQAELIYGSLTLF